MSFVVNQKIKDISTGSSIYVIVFQYQSINRQQSMNLQSPQYSSSGKVDFFSKQRSPSSRTKRVPSMQQPFPISSNHNFKSPKAESPLKASEEIRRRKSQHLESQSESKKKNQNSTQAIMISIQNLKEQYKILKQAYKQLIQEKVKNMQQIKLIKQENIQLKNEIQIHKNNNRQTKVILLNTEKKLYATQLQLQNQKKKVKKLENDLYFITQKQKSHTQNLIMNRHNNEEFNNFDKINTQQQNGSQKNIDSIRMKGMSSQSQFLSFSLTSIIEDSVYQEASTRRRKQHVKVISDLSGVSGCKVEFQHSQPKPKNDISTTFKKQKKEASRIQVISQSKESKSSSMINNPLSQLLNLKSPTANDKKGVSKNNTMFSKRCKKQDKENIDLKSNHKRKSKKILLIGPNQ